jgi:hypothetical protein
VSKVESRKSKTVSSSFLVFHDGMTTLVFRNYENEWKMKSHLALHVQITLVIYIAFGISLKHLVEHIQTHGICGLFQVNNEVPNQLILHPPHYEHQI